MQLLYGQRRLIAFAKLLGVSDDLRGKGERVYKSYLIEFQLVTEWKFYVFTYPKIK